MRLNSNIICIIDVNKRFIAYNEIHKLIDDMFYQSSFGKKVRQPIRVPINKNLSLLIFFYYHVLKIQSYEELPLEFGSDTFFKFSKYFSVIVLIYSIYFRKTININLFVHFYNRKKLYKDFGKISSILHSSHLLNN